MPKAYEKRSGIDPSTWSLQRKNWEITAEGNCVGSSLVFPTSILLACTSEPSNQQMRSDAQLRWVAWYVLQTSLLVSAPTPGYNRMPWKITQTELKQFLALLTVNQFWLLIVISFPFFSLKLKWNKHSQEEVSTVFFERQSSSCWKQKTLGFYNVNRPWGV